MVPHSRRKGKRIYMSQQEFQFEEQQEQTIDQLKQNKKRGDQPKSDHPSLFADSIPPYTYHAQHQEYADGIRGIVFTGQG